LNPAEHQEIVAVMMDELEKDPAFLPSAFWRALNEKNMMMLEADGIANFKRTLSQNYYNWLITSPLHPQFLALALRWLRKPSRLPFRLKVGDVGNLRTSVTRGHITLTAFQKWVYGLFVGFGWELMRRYDRHGLHAELSEPLAGNPMRIHDGDRLISQDLANSIIECNAIVDALEGPDSNTHPKVAEIGAGSGRLAHAYASTQPGTYFIFDIPPALAVSQWYLSEVLGEDRIFRFRPFDDFAQVEAEMLRAKVVFLTANQIRQFPDRYFDVVASISTLPEMRPDQVELYLSLFGKLAKGAIFLKQWKSWRNDADGLALSRSDIDFGSSFSLEMDRIDPVNAQFYNRVWRRIA
jgi:putative sugar O-methyltransferase